MKTELFFVRHGESVPNTQREFIGGRSNEAELTFRGNEQAYCAGKHLKLLGITDPDALYASPAVRTAATTH